MEHAFSRAKGGFPSIRRNERHHITATLPTEVCHDVYVEPDLHCAARDCWLIEWSLSHARFDISANGVWGGRFEKTYFDVRVLNPLAPMNSRHRSAGMYRAHEREKKRAYEQCVREVEHSSFTRAPSPICHWRHGNEATTFFKHLASLLAETWDSH